MTKNEIMTNGEQIWTRKKVSKSILYGTREGKRKEGTNEGRQKQNKNPRQKKRNENKKKVLCVLTDDQSVCVRERVQEGGIFIRNLEEGKLLLLTYYYWKKVSK